MLSVFCLIHLFTTLKQIQFRKSLLGFDSFAAYSNCVKILFCSSLVNPDTTRMWIPHWKATNETQKKHSLTQTRLLRPYMFFPQLRITPTPQYGIWTDAKTPRKRLKYRIGNIKWNQSDEFKFVLLFVSQLFSLPPSLPSSFLPSCPLHLHIHLYYLRAAYKWTCTSFSLWHFRLLRKSVFIPQESSRVYTLIINRKSNQM